MKVEFQGDRILLRFPNYRSAKQLQKVYLSESAIKSIARGLFFSEMEISAQIGKRNAVQIFPQPSWLVRLLSPYVRKLVKV